MIGGGFIFEWQFLKGTNGVVKKYRLNKFPIGLGPEIGWKFNIGDNKYLIIDYMFQGNISPYFVAYDIIPISFYIHRMRFSYLWN